MLLILYGPYENEEENYENKRIVDCYSMFLYSCLQNQEEKNCRINLTNNPLSQFINKSYN